jgi:hypothetical protein
MCQPYLELSFEILFAPPPNIRTSFFPKVKTVYFAELLKIANLLLVLQFQSHYKTYEGYPCKI